MLSALALVAASAMTSCAGAGLTNADGTMNWDAVHTEISLAQEDLGDLREVLELADTSLAQTLGDVETSLGLFDVAVLAVLDGSGDEGAALSAARVALEALANWADTQIDDTDLQLKVKAGILVAKVLLRRIEAYADTAP